MKYFSMFSGVGGFELGIQRAFDNELTSSSEEAGQAEPDQDLRQVRQRKAISEVPRSTGRFGATDKQDKLQPRNESTTLRTDKGRSTSSPELAEKHGSVSTVSDGDGGRSYADCIGYSEIDKYAIETYEHNWKGHKNYGDATTIDERGLPDFDLLVGGFPCQAFSIAGKRHGFNETRGTLFFDIARILSHKRPRHLVLENVKGLLSHDSGKTFATIIGVLTDLGYVIEWQVLNAKNFGVPQNRERVFIVGHLGACCGRQVFPIIGNNGQTLKNAGYLNSETWQKRNESIRRVYDPSGIAPTTPTGTGGGVMTKIIQKSPDWRSREKLRQFDKHSPAIRANMGDNHPMVAIDMTRRVGRGYKERQDGIMSTLTSTYYKGIGNAERPGVLENAKIRRLTPTECERLMSWPDGWTIGSDTQRYKQCGNGVVSNCVQAVIEALYLA